MSPHTVTRRGRRLLQRSILWLLSCTLALLPALSAAQECKGTLYLTIDTGWMDQADYIAGVLNKYHIKATFFMANERTYRGDYSLDPSWAGFWKARVAEGHAFGTHTWNHGYFRGDRKDGRILYVHLDGKREELDRDGFCHELNRVDDAFYKMTGRRIDRMWRAPGGITTPRALAFARQCGYTRHVKWPPSGFLGDELPSETYPNAALLKKSLHDIKDGDILLMHWGIHSRKDPWAPGVLDPLLTGLKARGFCFDTLKAGS